LPFHGPMAVAAPWPANPHPALSGLRPVSGTAFSSSRGLFSDRTKAGRSRLAWLPRALACCVLHSHAKKHQLPYSERERKSNRRQVDIHRRDAPSRRRESVVINSPTKYRESRYRANHNSQYRARIPDSKSPGELLRHVQEAIDGGHVDSSIITVAMKRCGGSRWWDALLQVRGMQTKACVPSDAILQSVFLTALAACCRGMYGFGIVHGRSKQILALGKQAWIETSPDLPSLTSALKLCMAVEDIRALEWAEMLWLWAGKEGHQSHWMAYMLYVQILATYKLTDRVDELLLDLKSIEFDGSINHLLASLVDIAGNHHDCERADELWHRFVDLHGVDPNHIAYASWAKAHFLCVRPGVAASKFDDMLRKGMKMDGRDAVSHAQQLLVTYHSTLSPLDLDRLNSVLARGKALLNKSAKGVKQAWQQIFDIAQRLQSDPTPLHLQDVLVDWKASKQSVMKDWDNYPAGSRYLADSD